MVSTDIREYGYNGAVLLSHFDYWLSRNWAAKVCMIEGRPHTYVTAKQLQSRFPFMSLRTVERTLSELFAKGVLIRTYKGRNGDKHCKILMPTYSDDRLLKIKPPT